ncbi:site-specific DNA-methyltransferase [bacterium]|nr:site-specific DNA-methyltransferase [bacterium]
MKQRMEIAYDLLTDGGVIFISLDDNMQAYFKVMMDSVFGEENFIDNLI